MKITGTVASSFITIFEKMLRWGSSFFDISSFTRVVSSDRMLYVHDLFATRSDIWIKGTDVLRTNANDYNDKIGFENVFTTTHAANSVVNIRDYRNSGSYQGGNSFIGTGTTTISNRIYYTLFNNESLSYLTLPRSTIKPDGLYNSINNSFYFIGNTGTGATSNSYLYKIAMSTSVADTFTTTETALLTGVSLRRFAFNQSSTDPVWIFLRQQSGTQAYKSTEAEPTTFTSITLPVSTVWSDIGYGNGNFVIISPTNRLYYSSNGDTWTVVDMAEVATRSGFPGTIFRFTVESRIEFLWQNFWVYVTETSNNRGFILQSPDGITWKATEVSGWTTYPYTMQISKMSQRDFYGVVNTSSSSFSISSTPQALFIDLASTIYPIRYP